LVFNLFRIFPIKSNKVCFITNKSASFESNLKTIEKEFGNRLTEDGKSYECNFVLKDQFSLSNFYNLATSKYIFLSDNFFPIAFMNFSKSTIISQLWHAPGVFKKFGYDTLSDDEKKVMEQFGNRIDYLFVSSKNIVSRFAHNFAMAENKTVPLGIPRVDFYSECKDVCIRRIRSYFEKKYPHIRNKKIILYAPTFRDNPKYNAVFNYFDIDRFSKELGDDYVLFVKLHPNYSNFENEEYFTNLDEISSNKNIINCTDFKDEQKLFLISDILITDYSSVMVEYSLLNKPIILFAYDLDNYINNERGFYFDYKEKVPGKIAYTFDDVVDFIKNNDFDLQRLNDFAHYQFDYFDGKSSKRIVDYVLDK